MRLPQPKNDAQRKRLKEWKAWLNNFRLQHNGSQKFKYIPNAAWLLNDLYWRLAEQYLRPVLNTPQETEENHKIHPYKIISTSEITVMMTEPIEVANDEKTEKQLNALLAWFIANQIIEGWETGSPIKITTSDIAQIAGYTEHIEKNKRYPESFAAEHIQWLTMLNVTIEKPLLINAQCWRLFYISCLAVAGKGKLQ
jgi:hypothetical protein